MRQPGDHNVLDYAAVPGRSDAAERRISFPDCEQSAHSATMSESARFSQVVFTFLEESGIE